MSLSKHRTKADSALSELSILLQEPLDRVDQLMVSRLSRDVTVLEALSKRILRTGGKRLRPLLILTIARWFDCRGDRPITLAAAIELIHTATLYHDDVVDESQFRRGQPSANALWGNTASVLVGDYLLSQSFQLMVSTGSLDMLRSLSQAAAIIVEGELRQLALMERKTVPRENYFKVIDQKTAQLFSTATEVSALASGLDASQVQSMAKAGMEIGRCFQMIDDILDYQLANKSLGKPVGQDFKESKRTLPWILAWEGGSRSQRQQLAALYKKNPKEDQDLTEVLALFEETNAITHAYQYAQQSAEEAKALLLQFPKHPIQDRLIEVVMDLVHRQT